MSLSVSVLINYPEACLREKSCAKKVAQKIRSAVTTMNQEEARRGGTLSYLYSQ